jgi:hypothetical protein
VILSPLMLWVRISIRARSTTLCDKVCQWLATGRRFSLGLPVSSTNKADRHDITELLLKVALNTIKHQQAYKFYRDIIISKLYIMSYSVSILTISYEYNLSCVLKKSFGLLKAYSRSNWLFFVYIKSCPYSMFYTNKMSWTRSQV